MWGSTEEADVAGEDWSDVETPIDLSLAIDGDG